MNYNELLADMVKAAGKELIDRAEDLVGHGDLISNFNIWIRFPQGGEPPTIEVTREHISRDAYDVYTNRGR